MRSPLSLLSAVALLAACADHDAGRIGTSNPQVANIAFRTRAILPLDVQRSVDLVVEDLDGDGITDLAAADLSGRVQIRIGQDDGEFTTRESLLVTGEPLAIESSDLDRDGLPDLVVASAGTNVATVFRNVNGNTFQQLQSFDVQELPTGMVLGDLDGNGTTDMVITHLSRSDLLVFSGQPDGTFGSPQSVALPRGTRTAGLTIADANDDGQLDVLICDTDNDRVVIRLNNDYTSGGSIAVIDVGQTPIALSLGDADGDGDADIAVSNFDSNRIDLIRHDGGSQFSVFRSLPVGGRPARSVIADVDADGFVDLAVCLLNKSAVSVFHGSEVGLLDAENVLPATGFPYRPLVADLTADGIPDLGLVSSNLAEMNVLEASANGLLTGRTTASEAIRAQMVCAGDFDLDGREDIAVAGTDVGTLAILSPTGRLRGPSLEQTLAIDVGRTFSNIQTHDVDQDGREDLVLGVRGGVQILANTSENGQISFAPVSGTIDMPLFAGSIAAEFAVADLTGDGALDLAMTFFGDETVAVAPGTGAPFGFDTPVVTPLPGRPFSLGVGDFDTDGRPELAVSLSARSAVAILDVDQSGAVTASTMLDVGDNPTYLRVDDFDGDGRADIAVSNANENTVQVLIKQLGEGFAGFEVTTSAVPTALRTEDVDRDGFPDLTITTLNGMSFEVVLSDGLGGTRARRVFPGVYGATSAVYADVTGSDFPDLVIGSGEIDRVTVFENQSILISR